MSKSRADIRYEAQLQQYRDEERRMMREAARIRKILSKDPDWALATGKKTIPKGEQPRFYRILAAKTKKAVRMLYPDLPICVRWKSEKPGAINHWIKVWMKVEPDIKKYGRVRRNIQTFLDALGLAYDSFYCDGPDCVQVSCVSVSHAPYTVRHPEKA